MISSGQQKVIAVTKPQGLSTCESKEQIDQRYSSRLANADRLIADCYNDLTGLVHTVWSHPITYTGCAMPLLFYN